jgi:hypothetical protein
MRKDQGHFDPFRTIYNRRPVDDDVCISMTVLPVLRSVREWFVDIKVPEMDCPAQSPDLNPIEHLWDELERRLCSKSQRFTSLTALATALQEEWAAIPQKTFSHLVESLPIRVRAVRKTKGGPTPRLGSVSQKRSDYSFK